MSNSSRWDIAAPNALAGVLTRIEDAAVQEGMQGGDGSRSSRVSSFTRYRKKKKTSYWPRSHSACVPGLHAISSSGPKMDAQGDKRFGSHYRRFINIDRFVEKATAGRRFECFYRVEGQGMAKYLEEDPFVGRVFLRRL